MWQELLFCYVVIFMMLEWIMLVWGIFIEFNYFSFVDFYV